MAVSGDKKLTIKFLDWLIYLYNILLRDFEESLVEIMYHCVFLDTLMTYFRKYFLYSRKLAHSEQFDPTINKSTPWKFIHMT